MGNISVLGAGTWGTALAIELANKGQKVTLWSAVPAEIEALRADRTQIRNLPGAMLPESIELTTDLAKACDDEEILVCAVASPYVRETAAKMKPFCRKGQIIVNVSKGIEEKTLLTMTQVIEQEIPDARMAVLSGPSHAEEVSRGIPTAVVVGAEDGKTAKIVQEAFFADMFRVYTSDDMLGIELGGSLKNVIALAAGMVDGLAYGDNTKAALMTRGIAEISRLGVAMGGRESTFYGLSGIGDLIVTCTSNHSRNHNAGYLIGQGKSTEDALAEVGQVVEGVNCAKAALALGKKYKVSLPIVEEINDVLFHGESVRDSVMDLLRRNPTEEYHGAV
ncbi:MAG: NAD(P)-dependent glycerol-3-phosphate dehydrogenase [Lachnospiraceae bacterium]|nr:NAD(P)-dependent glycerol-3-phosphate dehydrogenase [Lachnospiraceae bacterium]